MPLTRSNVTVAARIMLPTYPVLSTCIGLNYLIVDDRLLQAGVTFRVADSIMPLHTWGLMFLGVALIQVLALIAQNRHGYMVSLGLMTGAMTTWAVVGLMAAVRENGSYTAAPWPGFVVTACVASFLSLNAREV